MPFHLFTFLVILLALTGGRCRKSNLYDCRTFKAAYNGIIKSIHVLGKESLTDSTEILNFLVSIRYYLSLANSHC